MFVQDQPVEKKKASETDFRNAFECLGVVTGVMNGSNVSCDCPFCEKPGHFFLNIHTSAWDCKRCTRSGNIFTFMEQWVGFLEDKTKTDYPEKYDELAAERQIPVEAFHNWGFGWNHLTEEWVFPGWTGKGTVRDVRRWQGRGIYSTDSMKSQLFGMYLLASTTDRHQRRVWICEGEWDGIAMHWLLKACSSSDVVVAVPGAGTFKADWVNWFRGCHVVHAYDNDDSGDRGSTKASDLLKHVTRRQQFVCWPESLKSGWDVRDQIAEGLSQKMDPADILHGIEELIQNDHRRSATADATKPSTLARDVGPVATYNEVLTVFKRWVKLDRDFMDCLICALATVLSNHIPGEPLWTYLIGPSGGGKSLILCAFASSPKCSFHSAFTRTTLLSGYMRDPDPSLLPRLNGLTCVLKEGTEITQMHPDAKRDIYSTLRGAYDGRVDREFGNGKTVLYSDLHFNMLIGTTPAVRADNLATVGERFLSIEMYENPRSAVDKLYQVATNSAFHVQKQRDTELCDVVARFCSREVDVEQLPKIPEPIVHRIVAMAQLVELLRAQVERDPRDRDLKYRAVAGVGTRVVAQMVKYAQMIAVVLGKVEVDNDVCRILRKIMADTATGFHVDIVKSLVLNKNQPLTTGELAQTSRMTGPTLTKRLEDMAVLKIVEPHRRDPSTLKRGEAATTKYALTERVMNLWEQSVDGVRRD